jgi:hypothetical protein
MDDGDSRNNNVLTDFQVSTHRCPVVIARFFGSRQIVDTRELGY